jgi:hypothetical protein
MSGFVPKEQAIIYLRGTAEVNGKQATVPITGALVEREASVPNFLSALSLPQYDVYSSCIIAVGDITIETPTGEARSVYTYLCLPSIATTMPKEYENAFKSYALGFSSVISIIEHLTKKLWLYQIALAEKEVDRTNLKVLQNKLADTSSKLEEAVNQLSTSRTISLEEALAAVKPTVETRVEKLPSIYFFMLFGALIGAIIGTVYFQQWQMTPTQASVVAALGGSFVGALLYYILSRVKK